MKRPLSRGGKGHAIFRRWWNGHRQKVVGKIFFPSSPNDLKGSQYFIDLYRKVCGNFWVDTDIFRYCKVIPNFRLPYDHRRQIRVRNWPVYTFIPYHTSITYIERLIWNEFDLEVISQRELLHWGTGRYLMNWIQVVQGQICTEISCFHSKIWRKGSKKRTQVFGFSRQLEVKYLSVWNKQLEFNS